MVLDLLTNPFDVDLELRASRSPAVRYLEEGLIVSESVPGEYVLMVGKKTYRYIAHEGDTTDSIKSQLLSKVELDIYDGCQKDLRRGDSLLRP